VITPCSSDDEVRRYMFGEHNDGMIQEVHKVVAFYRDDPRITREISPEMLGILKSRRIVLPDKLEEIVVLHCGLPVDTMSVEELSKYNESPCVRKSVA
jgi:hypothetical protein